MYIVFLVVVGDIVCRDYVDILCRANVENHVGTFLSNSFYEGTDSMNVCIFRFIGIRISSLQYPFKIALVSSIWRTRGKRMAGRRSNVLRLRRIVGDA